MNINDENGRLTEQALNLLEEFRTNGIEDILPTHVECLLECSKTFSGRISAPDTQKLLEVALHYVKQVHS